MPPEIKLILDYVRKTKQLEGEKLYAKYLDERIIKCCFICVHVYYLKDFL